MQFNCAILSQRDEGFNPVDLQIRLLVARDADHVEKSRGTARGVALKEMFAIQSVRSTDDRTWASLDMGQHPGANCLEVVGQIELGHRFPIAGIRPEGFVRVGNDNAHDDGRVSGCRLREFLGSAEIAPRAMGFKRLLRHSWLPRWYP